MAFIKSKPNSIPIQGTPHTNKTLDPSVLVLGKASPKELYEMLETMTIKNLQTQDRALVSVGSVGAAAPTNFEEH